MTDIMLEHMYMCSILVWKKARFTYREFDLKGDLVVEPHTRYWSSQSFITRLKLVWRELDIMAMNNWKKEMCRFAEDMI